MALKFMFCLTLLFMIGLYCSDESDNIFDPQWQLLTRKNFSTQIHQHEFVLLMVTVPWSGESRALRNELVQLMKYSNAQFGSLRLVLIYRNVEKLLGDVLVGSRAVNLLFYRQGEPYKYSGKLSAQNILASVWHAMTIPYCDLPLKQLATLEDVESFLQSTDKGVLLFDDCGWAQNISGNEKTKKRFSAIKQTNFKKSNKEESFGSNNPGTVSKKSALASQVMLESDDTDNDKDSPKTEISSSSSNEYKDILFNKSSCTLEEYNYFEILYANLSRFARDHMLPPERQKFGIISNRTVISALSLPFQERSSIILQFPDCPNCSKSFYRGIDLEEFVMTSHPVVTELEGEGYKLIPPLSTETPSLILFIDRASPSADLRRSSKEALQALRQVAFHYVQSFQSAKSTRQNKGAGRSHLSSQDKKKIIFPSSNHLQMQFHQSPELLKSLSLDKNDVFQVKAAGDEIQIVNIKGDANLFGDSTKKILDYLLQQKSDTQLKQDRLALVAKKAGFQLLPSDYVLDLNQQSQIPETLSSLTEKTSGIPEEDFKNSGRKENIEGEELPKELGDKLDNIHTHIFGDKMGGTVSDEEQVNGINHENTNLDCKPSANVNNGHATIKDCPATAGHDEYKSESSEAEAFDDNTGERGSNKDSADEEYAEKINIGNQKDTCRDIGNGEQNLECTSVYKDEHVFFDRNGEESETLDDTQDENYSDHISFFFAEGGDQLKEILSSDLSSPSVVLIDPVDKTHYVLPKEASVSYSSLLDFIKAFRIGTLREYKRSEPFPPSPREPPSPPFVNRDFHEIDSTPRVTVSTFSKLILGFEGCNETVEISCASSHHPGDAWEKDVLVLFSNDWCGFCKRSQLIVREIHRFFKRCANFMHAEGELAPNVSAQDMPTFSTPRNGENLVADFLKDETTKGNVLKDKSAKDFPSIFQIDCTSNDCKSLLKSLNQKELYPTLLLFPAGRKDKPVAYEGDISVNQIIEFLAAHGSVSGHLYRVRGVLWNKMLQDKTSNMCTLEVSSSVPIQIQAPLQIGRSAQELLLSTTDQYGSIQHQSGGGEKLYLQNEKPAVGSILVSSEKLHGTYPFENSIILIVNAKINKGFEGLIVNKPLSWDDLPNIDIHIESTLKNTPINFGGPLIAKGMPLLSLTRVSNLEDFQEVLPGMYYGGPVATSKILEMIKSGEIPAHNFWFFLGFATWGWQQLFDELAAESWNLSTYREGLIRWPAHTT